MEGGVSMLPRGVTTNTTTGMSEIKGGSNTRPRKTGKPLRILVVEDHRDTADSLRLLLELYGYEVAVAYSGEDGVKAAEQYRPDVVLCDIGLPGLDGYRVARRLRDNPTTARARLIAVTAYGQDEDRRRSHEAGFQHHLVKPMDPDALLRLLNLPMS
jgi:CheY-like chemotaxis protein